ncbi:response regulator [Altericista sp. CCNU0014]|uniref:response regulator n=1 Tax=Altericista sp. CCNU0014 TaxID=3082949 RepID=UPI00384F4928
MKILLIEDDRNLAFMLQEMLQDRHYLVDVAFDGESGLDLAIAFEYDLILLDVMLPKQSGIRVCQQLRARRNQVPVLILTAQSTSDQKVAGLDAGADDYLTKPLNVPELLARIRALLRRGQGAASPVLEWQGLQLDPTTFQVTGNGQLVPLTAKEYGLVELFLRNPQQIFSQSVLVERLWDSKNIPTENAVRAHIKSLRKKLKTVGLGDLVETVFGLGYRLRQGSPDAAEVTAPALSDVPASASSSQKFADLWQESRPQYIERAEHLNRAIAALSQDRRDWADMLRQAQQQAHTLSGSLGSFGLERASQLAAQINRLLRLVEQLQASDLERLERLALTLQQELQVATAADVSLETVHFDEPKHPIRLLIVDDDLALTHQLATLSEPYGIQTRIEPNPALVVERVSQWQPEVVLLDLNFPDAPDAGFALLRALFDRDPQLPVIVFTARDRYSDRVKASMLGGSVFLQKPVAPSTVISTVFQAYTQSDPREITLMQVNADVKASRAIESHLTAWGFQWTTVKTVQQCWKTMPDFQPELLLVDADLPKGSGFDLCRVVRNEPRWHNLPVIFMVTDLEPEIVRQVCIAGGSACLFKPVAEAELIARILQRIRIRA